MTTVQKLCTMRSMSVSPKDRVAISAKTRLSTATVARYYAGGKTTEPNVLLIEMACKRLKLPTRDQCAAHDQDPRTFDGEG